LAAVFPLLAAASSGQDHTQPELKPANELLVLGVNVALGGLTAGATRALAGGSFWEGFSGGALGGGTVYIGKRIVATNQPLAGWAGRELAAVGSSAIANVAFGRGAYDRLVFPVGPIRLYLDAPPHRQVRPKLDLAATLLTIQAATDHDVSFSVEESLLAGAIVFAIKPNANVGYRGSQSAGVLRSKAGLYEVTAFPVNGEAVLAHELVHAIQYDFSFIAWAEPAESWLMTRIPRGAWFHRYLDLGLNVPVWWGLNSAIKYENRPWEREAVTLVRQE